MNMLNLEILEELLKEGTLLVQKVATGEISIQDFIKRYNNFYYYNALDGHEADDATLNLFKKYSKLIEFHRIVQKEIVDCIVFENQTNLKLYLETGRITPDVAKTRILTVLKRFGL